MKGKFLGMPLFNWTIFGGIIAALSIAFYFHKKNWEAEQESLIESQVKEQVEEVISQYRVEADKEEDEIIYTLKKRD